MTKKVLMIAFQFPPYTGSSAVQRTLRFTQYLPEFGWNPIVLSADPRAYEFASNDQLDQIPARTVVHRAICLDAARHLGIARRYPAFLARPDRWKSWWLFAVPAGLRLIRKHRPLAIWSTFPIPTAHSIGATLSRRSGLPWIADFRDPMVQPNDPADPALWRAYEKIERRSIAQATVSVFTTPGTRELFRARYPQVDPHRFRVIENGYDESSFTGLDDIALTAGPLAAGRITLLHSGAIYPLERDPTHLFRAIALLRDRATLKSENFRLRLRATGHDTQIRTMAAREGIEALVEFAPPVPYREALLEMMRADALIVLQAKECNAQIPAKIYEYLRAKRPLIGLTDPNGQTADVLRRAGVRSIARLDSAEEIAVAIEGVVANQFRECNAAPDASFVAAASRQHRTRELAALLDQFATERRVSPPTELHAQ